ncbi:MAG: hypothetical protein AAF709_14455 [Pseudomonadota bacterium]
MDIHQTAANTGVKAWSIQYPSRTTSGKYTAGMLRYGNTTLELNKLRHCQIAKVQDWDIAGQHFNFILYVIFAAFFLFLIVEAAWRFQFFAAVALFFAIAGMSLADVITTNNISYFRVDIKTTDGAAHTYTTASQQDAEELLAAMSASGVRVRR